VVKIKNHLEEARLRWLGHLERMDETNLIKSVREEEVSGHMNFEVRMIGESIPGCRRF